MGPTGSLARNFSRCRIAALVTIFSSFALFASGCGSSNGSSGSGGNTPPPPPGNTNVAVLLTSTGNDQLSEYDVVVSSVTITNSAGKATTLLTSGQGESFELMHANGTVYSAGTIAVPQDTYTSASVSLTRAQFTFLSASGGSFNSACTFASTNPTATVNLPSPITVAGTAMAITINLQASKSASWTSCIGGTFTVTPTFTAAPITLAANPTGPNNGEMSGIVGQVSSVSAGSFSLAPDDGFTVQSSAAPSALPIATSANTVFQGVAGASALAAGMFVDLDAVIQADGSLLATRVAVEDMKGVNVMVGPILSFSTPNSNFVVLGTQAQGQDFSTNPPTFTTFSFSSNTIFQISDQFSNLGQLPFVPTFTSLNAVPGQSVYVSAAAVPGSGSTAAESVTLVPQTINGTVTAVTANGSFQVYTVSLAPYDTFPLLGQPSTVEVYVDGNTQLLNSTTLGTGSTFRFNGLVFNDNGTLRMDCGLVNDGVQE
jgi:Domain of unknown function (DUF5666)